MPLQVGRTGNEEDAARSESMQWRMGPVHERDCSSGGVRVRNSTRCGVDTKAAASRRTPRRFALRQANRTCPAEVCTVVNPRGVKLTPRRRQAAALQGASRCVKQIERVPAEVCTVVIPRGVELTRRRRQAAALQGASRCVKQIERVPAEVCTVVIPRTVEVDSKALRAASGGVTAAAAACRPARSRRSAPDRRSTTATAPAWSTPPPADRPTAAAWRAPSAPPSRGD